MIGERQMMRFFLFLDSAEKIVGTNIRYIIVLYHKADRDMPQRANVEKKKEELDALKKKYNVTDQD